MSCEMPAGCAKMASCPVMLASSHIITWRLALRLVMSDVMSLTAL
jgi:hypothetical protein